MRPPDDEPLVPDSSSDDDSESELRREILEHPRHPPAERSHDLKLAADLFEDVSSRRKTFELRINDRDFQVGDVLWLRAWDGTGYDGRSCRVRVTYITDGKRVGALQPGFVCMSIQLLDPT